MGEGQWITLDCERALYVDRGRSTILCDRLPQPVTLVVKLKHQSLRSPSKDIAQDNVPGSDMGKGE